MVLHIFVYANPFLLLLFITFLVPFLSYTLYLDIYPVSANLCLLLYCSNKTDKLI